MLAQVESYVRMPVASFASTRFDEELEDVRGDGR